MSTTTPNQPNHHPENLPTHDQTYNHNQTDPDPDSSRTAEAKTAFTASLNSIGTNYDHPLRARAENLHSTEAILRGQEEQVAEATAGLGRQNREMEGLLDGGREGLKEIGDVQNWAEVLERDLLVVEEVLRDVEGDRGDGRENGVDRGAHDGVVHDHGLLDGNEAHREDGARAANNAKKGWLKWW